MDNNDFDKYVQYVIAQVGEGNHTKDEMKEHLLSRGLSQEEVDEIVNEAFYLGREAEEEGKKQMSVALIASLAFPVVMCILLWIAGASIIKSCSFAIIVGGIVALVRVKLLKNKF